MLSIRELIIDRWLKAAVVFLAVLIALLFSALAWALLSSTEDENRSAPDSQTRKVAPERDLSGDGAEDGMRFRSLRRKAIEG